MLKKQFGEFLEAAHESTGTPQLGRAFFALASGLGYGQVAVIDGGQIGRSMRKALVFAVQGRSELASFSDANDYAAHPVIKAALEVDKPYLADDVRKREGISPEAWAATLPPEVRGGDILMLPVHDRGRCVLIVCCGGKEANTSPLAQATLHAAAHVFQDRLTALSAGTAQAFALTGREAECLQWISRGKTGAEISGITGISPRTVRYHLQNVKRKLGVNSALEAIVKLSSSARGSNEA
jgi:DNA-binding CsgD family transcriptional regulator